MKAGLAVMLATGAVGAEGLLVLFGAGCGDVSVGITLACFRDEKNELESKRTQSMCTLKAEGGADPQTEPA